MNDLSRDVAYLIVQVMIVSVETLGMVQWSKHFIRFKNGHTRYYAFVSLIVAVGCAIMNLAFSKGIAYIFNVAALSVAVTQLAYESVVNGLNSFINKAMGNAQLPKKEG